MASIYDFIDTLKSRCSCLDDLDNDQMVEAVEDMIYTISSMTCWSDDDCSTFIKSMRSEMFDVDELQKAKCCTESIFKFEPYFNPVYPDTFRVILKEDQGLNTEYTEFHPDWFKYDIFEGVLKIDLTGIAECQSSSACECKCVCACEEACSCTEKHIIIQYEAGYDWDEMPDCIISPMCRMLKAILAASVGCGSLDKCLGMTDRALGAQLVSYSVEDISYSWEYNSESVENQFQSLIQDVYMNRLAMLSLCDPLWGTLWTFRTVSTGCVDVPCKKEDNLCGERKCFREEGHCAGDDL